MTPWEDTITSGFVEKRDCCHNIETVELVLESFSYGEVLGPEPEEENAPKTVTFPGNDMKFPYYILTKLFYILCGKRSWTTLIKSVSIYQSSTLMKITVSRSTYARASPHER